MSNNFFIPKEMNYQQTLQWLFSQLPVYQLQGATAYKEDLTNTLLLAEHLKNPENLLHFIHVGGTNGKGSTSHLLASVLQDAGYKVGLYTSPHLKDFRERIKVNGKEISEEYVCEFVEKNKSFFEEKELSFFEMTVGLAFDYFVSQKTDINIIEVGMGGRLDATNIITPLVSVITNISKDHTQFLGTTMQSIATEKAGIIKKNIPVVIGEYSPEIKDIFTAKANAMQADIYFASDLILQTYPSSLVGDYQVHNKKTALQTIQVLQKLPYFVVSEENIKSGFSGVIANTGLQGRWQQLEQYPKVIADTAHNKSGLEIVLNQIQNESFEKLHIVLGVVNDKDLDEILPLFPKKATYYFCKPNIPRGLEVAILQNQANKFGLFGHSYSSISEAYNVAMKNAGLNDFIYIGGSTFVVAEIL